MCGIIAAVNWGDAPTLARMTELQRHRGPDDGGLWETRTAQGTWVGLGARRLAIVDLSDAGHMPMTTDDGRLTIVYNGEVYNYRALRTMLESRGYQFRSDTDTEVVLNLFHLAGPEGLSQLNGMFAFAVWDHADQALYLARDHFGIKPLYYVLRDDGFACASEVKSLLELPGCPRAMNRQALDQYLSFLWVPDPLTMFDGILKLPAGHWARYAEGRLTISPYWDLTFPPEGHVFAGDERSLAGELRQRLTAAVRSQMHSDVPLGAFLSAGLDSSSIVAAMAGASEHPVRTFTIALDERERTNSFAPEDPQVARRTAEHFGCRHTQIVVEADTAELLPKLVWHLDEPIADPAVITAYLINREARRDVTVLLSGVGGDELLAGYRKHQAHYLARWYRRLPRAVRQRMIEPAIAALPARQDWSLARYVRWAKKMTASGSLPPEDRFIMDSIYINESLKRELYADEARPGKDHVDPRIRHLEYFPKVRGANFLNQMLYVDTKAFMVSLNLTYNDKMSMATSTEVRVPFLDRELVEWTAWHVPPHLKLHRGTTKYLLREAMRGVLPDEVLRQPKAGFGAPVDRWLSGQLREMTDDLLAPERIQRRGLFAPATVARWIDEHRRGVGNWSMQIWQLLTLELWLQTFLDGTPLEVTAK